MTNSKIFKFICQILFACASVLLALYLINPDKAFFPTAFTTGLLILASLLQKSTLLETIRLSGLKRIFFICVVLLIGFAIRDHAGWRDAFFFIPRIISVAICTASLSI
jgi:hypothetical protein